jgi:Rrf2 family iron-sulfur cluster assembly transcriptional regulator
VKLGTKGRYAVMAMTDLILNSAGKPVALADIADRQDISVSYLEQLFAKLRRRGMVKSVRGPGGGYVLSRPPQEMRVSDIVVAVDESLKQTRCELDSPLGCAGASGRCLTHDLWAELGNQIYLFLSSVSLDDVVRGRVLGASGALHQERLGLGPIASTSAQPLASGASVG